MTNQDTKTELLPCTDCGTDIACDENCPNYIDRDQPVPAADAEALDPVVNGVPLQMYLDCWSDNPQQAICDLVRHIRALQRPAPVDVAHVLNEWADTCCSCIQWLRNIREGISTPDDALASVQNNYDSTLELSRETLRLLDSAGKVSPWTPVTDDLKQEGIRFVGTRFNGVVWRRPAFWHWLERDKCFRSGGDMGLRWDKGNQPTHYQIITVPPAPKAAATLTTEEK